MPFIETFIAALIGSFVGVALVFAIVGLILKRLANRVQEQYGGVLSMMGGPGGEPTPDFGADITGAGSDDVDTHGLSEAYVQLFQGLRGGGSDDVDVRGGGSDDVDAHELAEEMESEHGQADLGFEEMIEEAGSAEEDEV